MVHGRNLADEENFRHGFASYPTWILFLAHTRVTINPRFTRMTPSGLGMIGEISPEVYNCSESGHKRARHFFLDVKKCGHLELSVLCSQVHLHCWREVWYSGNYIILSLLMIYVQTRDNFNEGTILVCLHPSFSEL